MRIVVDVPKSQERRVLAAFCDGRYPDRVQSKSDPDKVVKNPQSKEQFVKQLVTQYVNQVVADAETVKAQEAAAAKVPKPPVQVS